MKGFKTETPRCSRITAFCYSENDKTRTLSCTGLKIHILWACEKPRRGNDLNYTPIAVKNNRPSEIPSDGIFCLPYRSLAVNAFKTYGYAVGGVFVRIFPQHFEGCDGSFQA